MSQRQHTRLLALSWLCSCCILVAGTVHRQETEQTQAGISRGAAQILKPAVRLGNLGTGHASIQIDFSGYSDDDSSSNEEHEDNIVTNSTASEEEQVSVGAGADNLPLQQLDTRQHYDENNEYFSSELAGKSDDNLVEQATPIFDLSTTNLDDLALPTPVSLVEKKPKQDPLKSHQAAMQRRKAQIIDDIKKRLNLAELPKTNMIKLFNNKKFPHHIIGGYDLMQNDQPKVDLYEPSTKIEQMIRFAQQLPSDKAIRIPESRLQSTMFFPMPMAVTDRSLKRATLLIYLETPYGFENQIATLNLTTNRITKNRGIHLSKVGLIDGGKWHHIDITKEAKAWTRGEWLNNLGLVAEATVEGIHIFHYNNSQLGQNSSIERMPIIKLDFNEGEFNNPRQKRSLDTDRPRECKQEDNEPRCCRYPFVLDFDELGEDFQFIISPKRYWANYCNGNCPDYALPNTGHMQLMRGLPQRSQRCCSPSHLQPLTLLYLGEMGDVMRGELQGMTIAECKCT